MSKFRYTLKEATLKPKDVDPAFLKRIEDMHGPVDMKNDFFSNDLDTYFKTSEINPETNSVEHQVIKLASFGDSLQKLSAAFKALKQLIGTEEGRRDSNIQAVADDLKLVFNKYRTHLRKNYPDQYRMIKSQLEEISTTAAGGDYETKFAFNPNKKADGAETNYYYKLGFKPAPKPKSSKTIDIVPLNEEAQQIEDYMSSLGIESPNLKKHISDRILGFNKLESKLNELVPLLGRAKQETMDKYREEQNFNIYYPTDLALDYLDDLIGIFKNEK